MAGRKIAVADAIDAAGYGKFQAYLFLLASLAQFTDGMEMLVLAFLYVPLRGDWGLSEADIGWLASGGFVGVFLGSIVFGIMADKWSRRWTVIIALAFVSVAGLASSMANDFATMMVLRMLVGFGMGGVGPSNMSTCSEFFPAERRGMLLMMMSLAWSVGELLECLAAALLLENNPVENWRLFVAVSAVPPLLAVFASILWLPESPRNLSLRNKEEELRRVLQRAAKTNGREKELNELLEGNELQLHSIDSSERGSVKELFHPGMRVMTACIWVIWFVQVFVYYGAVFILPAIIANLSAQTEVNSTVYAASALSALMEMPGTILAAFTAEISPFPSFGRRHQLVFFMFAAVVFSFVAGVFGRDVNTMVGAVMCLKFAISGSFAVTWTFTTELYPTADRATGLGAASAIARIGGMLTPVVSSVLLHLSVGYPFFSYAACAAMGCVAVLGVESDTKGLELTDSVEEKLQQVHDGQAEQAPLLDGK